VNEVKLRTYLIGK